MKQILFFIILLLNITTYAKLIKMSNDFNILVDDAQEWSCVIDDKLELIWEVKKLEKDLQYNENAYTWFDGNSGVKNGKYSRNCHWGKNCNSLAFINAINNKKICTIKTWRLPTQQELASLLVFKEKAPLINNMFFPNTKDKSYWTSQNDVKNPDVAIDIPFFYGGNYGSDKSFYSYIRAVSSVKQKN